MRIKNAFRNSFFSVISQIILIAVGFFSQRVLNLKLGEELIGMNSVISNINAILSISELGMSTAVIFHLYKAFAQGDEAAIASLMKLYRKAYCIISATIVALGLCILPFVHIFLRENHFTLEYIRLIFFLWLLRSALSCLLSYKRSILIADQKEYIVSIALLLANVTNYLVVIFVVQYYGEFAIALAINILIEILMNLWVSNYVNRKYVFLKKYQKNEIEKSIVKKVFQDIKNIFVTRMSTNLLVSTDNLIMSSFISVGIVGLYSNYAMIIQSVTNVLEACSNALQPTVGNMFTEEDHEKEYGLLRQITFLFFIGASFASVSLIVLMTPFVSDIWLGKSYVLEFNIILFCIINFFVRLIGMPIGMMMGVTGLFKKERNLSIIVAVVNIFISLSLVIPFGVIGVLFGTLVSYMIQIIYRIYVLINEYMKKNCYTFVLELLQYSALAGAEICLALYLNGFIYKEGKILSFLLLMIICLIVPNGINFLVFRKSWRFKSIINMIQSLFSNNKKIKG